MDAETLAVLRGSLAQLIASKVDVAEIFYRRLFELAPGVRSLFKPDLSEQRKKLITALVQIVAWADQPQQLTGYLQRMGARHTGYGTLPEHYDVVGAVLLWTFDRALGPEFTPTVREAWTIAYKLVATIMREGAVATSPTLPRIEPVAGI